MTTASQETERHETLAEFTLGEARLFTDVINGNIKRDNESGDVYVFFRSGYNKMTCSLEKYKRLRRLIDKIDAHLLKMDKPKKIARRN